MIQILDSIDALRHLQRTGMTIGNFDGVHLGHQQLIRRMLEICARDDLTPLVITFWPHPRQVVRPDRGHRPLATRDERFALLEGLGVPCVLEMPFTPQLAAMEAETFVRHVLLPLGLRHLVVGHDFSLGHDRGGQVPVLRALGASLGFAVEQLAAVLVQGEVVSSTTLRTLIARGAVARAATLLGRCHGFSGEVLHGDGRGHTLGYPTANQAAPDVLLPAEGVYATRVSLLSGEAEVPELSGRLLPAVTNVGRKPTFGGNALGVETYILDSVPDLYGRTLHVAFVERLRGEQRFASVEALRDQMDEDAGRARRLLASTSCPGVV